MISYGERKSFHGLLCVYRVGGIYVYVSSRDPTIRQVANAFVFN